MNVCALCACFCVLRGQKRALDTLKLVLEIVANRLITVTKV